MVVSKVHLKGQGEIYFEGTMFELRKFHENVLEGIAASKFTHTEQQTGLCWLSPDYFIKHWSSAMPTQREFDS